MKVLPIRKTCGLPVLPVIIAGPKASKRIELVFDSGAYITQIHKQTLTSIGYVFEAGAEDIQIKGVTGPAEKGYSITLGRLYLLEKMFRDVRAAAFDFSEWIEEGIDGLLG